MNEALLTIQGNVMLGPPAPLIFVGYERNKRLFPSWVKLNWMLIFEGGQGVSPQTVIHSAWPTATGAWHEFINLNSGGRL